MYGMRQGLPEKGIVGSLFLQCGARVAKLGRRNRGTDYEQQRDHGGAVPSS